MAAIGVQMQPVVVAPPDRPDRVRFLQDDRLEAPLLEAGRSCEPSRTGADDDRVESFVHAIFSALRRLEPQPA
jgi:hypothetical protein